MTETRTDTILALECVECSFIARTIAEAEQHEDEESTPDEPHGGWDTIRLAP